MGFLKLFDRLLNRLAHIFSRRGVVTQLRYALRKQYLNGCPKEHEQSHTHLRPIATHRRELSSGASSAIARTACSGSTSPERASARIARRRKKASSGNRRATEDLDGVTDDVERSIRNFPFGPASRAGGANDREGHAPHILGGDTGPENQAARGAESRKFDGHGDRLPPLGLLFAASTAGTLAGGALCLLI